MKKVIVISDSFKGTLSSREIGTLAGEVIRRHYPDCRVIALAAADGGEGTAECFLSALPGERRTVSVSGPWGEKVEAAYAAFGSAAVIETAAAAGLPLVGERKDPSRTTTYGVGELILHALDRGARKIVLGLGGSATNDGGCGCAAALGCRFLDPEGREFLPVGATLGNIAAVDTAPLRERLRGVTVEAMCDVSNPLLGPEGAAAVYGPQKGADPGMVRQLDTAMAHLAAVLEEETALQVKDVPGSGAAGGFGAGVMTFLQGKLRPGIETVLDMLEFDGLLDGCDLVITGEGRLDGQSLKGKVPVGVARRAREKGVPVVALAGCIGDGAGAVRSQGITAMFNANRSGRSERELAAHAREDYENALEDILRLLWLGERMGRGS